ncbi:hypothetical protein ODJ79_05310 [Actinoplanes sp. KI2]|uniref:hypothetical protein n=1 Tax=Actinoplanes sp. KI2 TaxID=2983315 RepID=UPI0021D5AD62|nr:hypothetical protein [Actinoplanes sp. KI2]MCU7723125.1 hypothetical protein [Actinoplanes sp. KI2]
MTLLGEHAASASAPTEVIPRVQDTTRTRLVISALSLLAFLSGVTGLLADVPGLRLVGFVGYFLFGVGAAPWALLPKLDLPLRLALTVTTSLGALVIFSTAMLDAGAWQTAVATSVLCAVTVPLHVAGLAMSLRERRPPSLRITLGPLGPGVFVSGAGVLLCLVAALMHRHTDPGLWGFLAQIGPLWYVGVGLVVLSLAISRSYAEAATAIGVLALIVVLTGTQAIVYDLPRIQSSAKHVEMVQQIRHQHLLQSTVAVYNGWPGFFSAMAWLADAAGIRDPLHLATAWQLLIGLYRVVAMRWFAGQVIRDRRLIWPAVLFCALPDTIGQDYFSPQSVGFVLGILIFGFALSRLPLPVKAAAMIGAGLTMAVTHQLSPYIVGGALCVLVVFRQLKPWWLPATVLGTAVLWALVNWADISQFVDLSHLGRSGNLTTPTPTASSGLGRLTVFLAMEATLAVSLLILGALSLVVLWRQRMSLVILWRQRRSPRQWEPENLRLWALAACPGAGLAIVIAHPYGKEGLYRAVLFALPWLAVLAAQAFALRANRWWQATQLAVASMLTVNFVIGTFSLDASNVMRKGDLDAFAAYAQTHTDGGVNYCLVIGPGDVPSGPNTGPNTRIAVYRDAIDTTYGFTIDTVDAKTVETLTEQLIAYSGLSDPTDRLYAFWSPTSSYYGWEYGLHTPEQFAALRDAFAASPLWKVTFSEGGSMLFAYVGS